MSGSRFIKMCIEPTTHSIEAIIRGVLGGSLILYHAEVLDSRCQCIVLQPEFDCADELATEFSRPPQACSLIERAIHDVPPGAIGHCSAIWFRDGDWFYTEPITKQ